MEKSPLQNFTYGLSFVTARKRNKDSGCIVNTATNYPWITYVQFVVILPKFLKKCE